MAVPPFNHPFTRVPLWQLIADGQPYVCTDYELGTTMNQIENARWICACLGAAWYEQYRPEMKQLFRYTRNTTDSAAPWVHRVGFEEAASNPAWAGFTKGPALGWVFPHDHALSADDLTTVMPYQREGASTTAGEGPGYYYMNDLEILPGRSQRTPWPAGSVGGSAGFRLHAPQVVRVNVDWVPGKITITPEEAVVSSGRGAPIIWWRGESTLHREGMHWSFAELAINENTTPPSTPGQAYRPAAKFCVRHMTSDEIVVIDNNVRDDGSADQEFKYRLSVYDSNAVILSVDPKIRNGSGLGSGSPAEGPG